MKSHAKLVITSNDTRINSKKRKQSILDDYFSPKRLKQANVTTTTTKKANRPFLATSTKSIQDNFPIVMPPLEPVIDPPLSTKIIAIPPIPSNAILQSGAAAGADSEFHKQAKLHGHQIRNYVFSGERVYTHENLIWLTAFQLNTANNAIAAAAKSMQRNLPRGNEYIYNLLRRSYFQIIRSSAVFAVADFEPAFHPPTESNSVRIRGGTAWACQMFANNHKKIVKAQLIPLYLYAELKQKWFQCKILQNGHLSWVSLDDDDQQPHIPSSSLPGCDIIYTGIGGREITLGGQIAIRNLYESKKKQHFLNVYFSTI